MRRWQTDCRESPNERRMALSWPLLWKAMASRCCKHSGDLAIADRGRPGRAKGISRSCAVERPSPGSGWKAIWRRELAVWNLYGPTETTIWSLARRVGMPPNDAARSYRPAHRQHAGCYVLDAGLGAGSDWGDSASCISAGAGLGAAI